MSPNRDSITVESVFKRSLESINPCSRHLSFLSSAAESQTVCKSPRSVSVQKNNRLAGVFCEELQEVCNSDLTQIFNSWGPCSFKAELPAINSRPLKVKSASRYLIMAEVSQVLAIAGSVASMIATTYLMSRYLVWENDPRSDISTLSKIFEQSFCSIKEEIIPLIENDSDQFKRELVKLEGAFAELRNIGNNLGLGELFPQQRNPCETKYPAIEFLRITQNPSQSVYVVACLLFCLTAISFYHLHRADRYQDRILTTGLVCGFAASIISTISTGDISDVKTYLPVSAMTALILSSLLHRLLYLVRKPTALRGDRAVDKRTPR